MDLIPFKPEHLADIEPEVMPVDELKVFVGGYVDRGPAFSGVVGGRALICGGLIIEGAVGFAWAVISAAIGPMALHRAVVRCLGLLIEEHELERTHAICRADWPRAARWLERLGFRETHVVDDFMGIGPHRVFVK